MVELKSIGLKSALVGFWFERNSIGLKKRVGGGFGLHIRGCVSLSHSVEALNEGAHGFPC